MPQPYVVIVPVKPPALGKSRLRGLSDHQRRDLAEAFALDTATAALTAPPVARVLVATDDAAFASRFLTLGCEAIPDGAATGLNPTLVQAAAEAHRRWPELTPVALCADLPALRSEDLVRVLDDHTPDTEAFVADAAGTGTTLYTAGAHAFHPRFGVGSCRAHRDAGARAVSEPLASLRLDVDDLVDLRAAIDLGVGVHTMSQLPHLDLT